MREVKLNKFNLKSAFHNLLSNTSIYGVRRLVRSDCCLMRLVWLMTTILSAAFGVYILHELASDYQRHDVITQSKLIEPKSVIFPAITICIPSTAIKNHKLADMISTIDFKMRTLNVSKEIKSFESVGIYDNCIRFNHELDHVRTIEVPGFYSHSFRVFFSNDFCTLVFKPSYFHVYITDNYIRSFRGLVPIPVETTKQHHIAINKLVDVKLSEPYNQCSFNSSQTNYRQMNCIDQCIQKRIFDKYNCTYLSNNHSEFKSSHRCLTEIIIPKVRYKRLKSWENEFEDSCRAMCPIECTTVKYEMSLRTTNARKMLPFIQIFFSDIKYVELSQVPKMSVFTLISSVGGVMFLFVGLRALSCVELLEFTIGVLKIFFKS